MDRKLDRYNRILFDISVFNSLIGFGMVTFLDVSLLPSKFVANLSLNIFAMVIISILLLDFSNYLRMNLESINEDVCVPISQELEHTKQYIRIELLRFGERLCVSYDIEDLDFEIPSLTIQPMVENPIKHGVCERIEGGTGHIAIRSENGNYVIQRGNFK